MVFKYVCPVIAFCLDVVFSAKFNSILYHFLEIMNLYKIKRELTSKIKKKSRSVFCKKNDNNKNIKFSKTKKKSLEIETLDFRRITKKLNTIIFMPTKKTKNGLVEGASFI
jgi:hypothetical protein